MKATRTTAALTIIALAWLIAPTAAANSDDFGSVVKLIEQFYHVKHKGLPLLAKAGIKATATAARIRGGDAKRLAEAGSVRVAFFEDQDFDSRGGIADFKLSVTKTVGDRWSPLIQTLSPKDEEQTYIFLRDAGAKFNVLVVTIERHEATVVQVDLAPKTLALLMQSPNDMGKAITDDATKNDQE
jgi:hypothetical protein